jgi:hypothetical protein
MIRSAAALGDVGYALMTVSEHSLEWTYYGSSLEGPDPILDYAFLTR